MAHAGVVEQDAAIAALVAEWHQPFGRVVSGHQTPAHAGRARRHATGLAGHAGHCGVARACIDIHFLTFCLAPTFFSACPQPPMALVRRCARRDPWSLASPMPPAPASICLLRLSALGDVTHVLPLVNTLREAWPGVAITWVIGKGEHRLLQGLPGVRFLEYDKKTGLQGMRALRRELRGQRFDVLLQMQVAARANLLSAFIPAHRRIGYD